MKILHLADATFADKPGGSRKYAQELAIRLAERGNPQVFLVPKENPNLLNEEIWNSLQVYRYDAANPLAKQSALRKNMLALHARYHFDAVIVHFAYTAFAYHLLPTARRLPTLRMFQGPWDSEHAAEKGSGTFRLKAAHAVMHQIEKTSLQRSDRIIVLSKFMQQDAVQRFQIPVSKIRILPPGVDTERFVPGDKTAARQKFGISEDSFVVLTVRRLARRMGIDLLIQAAAIARKSVPNLEVHIAGKGPIKEELAEKIVALGLQKCVKLIGFVPDEDLADRYRSADVFALPTVSLEGFGLVVLEALACNVPVIGTPVAAIPDVLRPFGEDLIMSDCTPEAIAEGIVGRYNLRNTPFNSRKLIEAEYTWSRTADHIEQELQDIIASGK